MSSLPYGFHNVGRRWTKTSYLTFVPKTLPIKAVLHGAQSRQCCSAVKDTLRVVSSSRISSSISSYNCSMIKFIFGNQRFVPSSTFVKVTLCWCRYLPSTCTSIGLISLEYAEIDLIWFIYDGKSGGLGGFSICGDPVEVEGCTDKEGGKGEEEGEGENKDMVLIRLRKKFFIKRTSRVGMAKSWGLPAPIGAATLSEEKSPSPTGMGMGRKINPRTGMGMGTGT